MKNKKGSHVGIVLSFVLFVTAILFLYQILSPSITKEEDKGPLVNQIEQKLPDYLESTLYNQKISLRENCCDKYTCFKFEKNNAVKKMSYIVKDIEDREVNSYADDESLFIKNSGKNYFNVFFSEQNFSRTEVELENCDFPLKEDYTSAFSSKEYYFQKKIEQFILNLQDQNFYSSKKTELLLPEGSEFSLVFVYQNGSKFGIPPNENISTNVFVEQISIYYVDLEAKVNPGFLEIGVW